MMNKKILMSLLVLCASGSLFAMEAEEPTSGVDTTNVVHEAQEEQVPSPEDQKKLEFIYDRVPKQVLEDGNFFCERKGANFEYDGMKFNRVTVMLWMDCLKDTLEEFGFFISERADYDEHMLQIVTDKKYDANKDATWVEFESMGKDIFFVEEPQTVQNTSETNATNTEDENGTPETEIPEEKSTQEQNQNTKNQTQNNDENPNQDSDPNTHQSGSAIKKLLWPVGPLVTFSAAAIAGIGYEVYNVAHTNEAAQNEAALQDLLVLLQDDEDDIAHWSVKAKIAQLTFVPKKERATLQAKCIVDPDDAIEYLQEVCMPLVEDAIEDNKKSTVLTKVLARYTAAYYHLRAQLAGQPTVVVPTDVAEDDEFDDADFDDQELDLDEDGSEDAEENSEQNQRVEVVQENITDEQEASSQPTAQENSAETLGANNLPADSTDKVV